MSKSMACFLFVILCASLHAAVHGAAHPFTSCSQLPYPELCNGTGLANAPGGKHFGFRESNFNYTMEHFEHSHRTVMAVNLSALNDPREREAWTDCLSLIKETIAKLGRCMETASNEDSQTWLSAALADQVTCLSGFTDFNLSVPPVLSKNLTELLSNSLAINKAKMGTGINGGNRRLIAAKQPFPRWVSTGDRKLLQSSKNIKYDLVVAKDGSGDYKTINEAVKASRTGSKRFVIYVKEGVYSENVEITKSMTNLMIIGDGIDKTVVTGSKNVVDGSTTFRSATFITVGEGFIAKDMTFENTAGPEKHQAVALRSGADFSVFYRCSFKGYQDTLYVHSQRQFYRNCDIYGTVDFIFGDSVTVIQNCNIYVRKPMSNQKNTVTAQGRSDKNENTGISIHNSVVAATSDLKAVQGSIKSFLGRPWKEYSRTVFMKCKLGSLIAPEGWLEWSGDFALDTLYYGEYRNTGAGADTSERVSWKGYHVIKSKSEAEKFTVGEFLSGDSWLPATGVPFTSGL